MLIHPKARSIFSDLRLPGPLQKHFSHITPKIDLSNSTNPFLDTLANYPDLGQEILKKHYLDIIETIHRPDGYSSSLTYENVLFTVGSLEAIDLLLRTFAEPNVDTIVVTSPSFMAYEHWGRLHNLQIEKVPLLGEDFNSLDVQRIVDINPKIVFLCSPNNPSGTMLDPVILQQLCQAYKGLIVVDEAYIEVADAPSCLYDLSLYPHLIVLRTLSKAWGLAGIRCGAVLADPAIIHTLRYIQVPFGLATPSQDIFLQRCANPESMYHTWQQIKKEREQMTRHLQKLSRVQKVFPSQSTFLLVILKDFNKTLELLGHHGIYVNDCSANIPNAIKVSVGSAADNAKFLEVMD